MLNYLKYSLICFFCVIAFFCGRPALAQTHYPEFMFKDPLIQTLFQYGREVFYRGVDPQEASFVFQRILTLDCRHEGAQEFLARIHKKYPGVSIKVRGCSQEVKAAAGGTSEALGFTDQESVKPATGKSRHISFDQTDLSIKSETPVEMIDELAVHKEVTKRATPLRAFSEPMTLKESDFKEIPQELGLRNDFPIRESGAPAQIAPDAHQEIHAIAKDCDKLRVLNKRLEQDIVQLRQQIKIKEEAIVRYQEQIVDMNGGNPDVSYALIAQDQRDLIRIQQENIDYLGKELAELKAQVFGKSFEADPAYADMRQQIASAQLTAKENEMNLEARNREALLLQKQLGEHQEQLRLVKKILSEKNDMIKSLQDEIQLLRLRK